MTLTTAEPVGHRHLHAAKTRRLAGPALLVIGAVLTAVSSGIHLHLWMNGYRHIPTIGPMFLAQVVAGFALALGLAATRRPLVGAAAFVFMASTIGGFILSTWVGLFGFKDAWSAPYAQMAFAVEVGALIVLAGGVLLGGGLNPVISRLRRAGRR